MIGGAGNRRAITKSAAGLGAILLTAVSAAFAQQASQQSAHQTAPSATESLAAWDRIVAVLEHPRCLNCHQDKTPLQGDERRVHIPRVVRGPDNQGVGAMRCGNCHNERENSETSGVPGAGDPGEWQLAPVSMLWQDLSSGELCNMLKDPARNNGLDGPRLIHHMDTDARVQWGWKPGGDRTGVPVPRDEFVNQMKIWVAGGMKCPD